MQRGAIGRLKLRASPGVVCEQATFRPGAHFRLSNHYANNDGPANTAAEMRKSNLSALLRNHSRSTLATTQSP
jgi:hypothetical protein